MDQKLQVAGTQSQFEMGSLAANGSPHEFEDECLFSPESVIQKMQPGHISEYGSAPGGFQPGGSKMWKNVVYKSIKTVVFSNKLNALMPFGPLAILVHILTGHNGLVFLLSLLGIIPLAERLGYATEQLAMYTGPTDENINMMLEKHLKSTSQTQHEHMTNGSLPNQNNIINS